MKEKTKLFKDIFKLDPVEVEEFIRNKIETNYSSWYKDEDVTLIVEWCVPFNEFYVYTRPKMVIKENGKTYYKNKKMTLKKYQDVIFNHWHLSFQEVYGEMTGKTIFIEEATICDNSISKALNFIYEKKWTEVCLGKNGKWYISEWAGEKETRKEVPEKLMKAIEVLDGKD